MSLNSDIEHISEVLHRQVKQKEDTETDALSSQSLSLTETGIRNYTNSSVLNSGSHELSFPMHLLLDAEGLHTIRSAVHTLTVGNFPVQFLITETSSINYLGSMCLSSKVGLRKD